MLAVPISRLLVNRGYDVTVVFCDDYSIYNEDIQSCKVYHKFSYSLSDCNNICKGMQYVIHSEGYRGNVGLDIFKSAEYFVKNTSMHINMLESARANNVEKYVFASSCGSLMSGFNAISSPSQVYGSWHKIIGESQCNYYTLLGMKIAIIRFGSVYGPYDTFDANTCSVVASAIRQLSDNNIDIATFWGDGTAIRDFIYADDCARGIVSALDYRECEPVEIGTCGGTSIKQLIDLICKLTKSVATIRWDAMKPTGEQVIIMNKYTHRNLGFTHIVSLEEGLSRTINWYIKRRI